MCELEARVWIFRLHIKQLIGDFFVTFRAEREYETLPSNMRFSIYISERKYETTLFEYMCLN